MTSKAHSKILTWWSVLLCLFLLLSACAPKATPTPVAQFVATSVAATMQSLVTQEAASNMAIRMTEIAKPTLTATPQPSPTVLPTLPPQPSPTAVPAQPVQPAASAVPAASVTPKSTCLMATVISSSTTDGQVVKPSAKFTQTWVLKNSGTCTWNGEFDLIAVGGDDLGAKVGSISQTVKPGESIQVSVEMTAPSSKGDYTSYWMFLDDRNARFGIGADGKGQFAVHVKVQ